LSVVTSRPGAKRKTRGTRKRPGTWKKRTSERRETTITARKASAKRPASPPSSCVSWMAPTVACTWGRGSPFSSGSAGTICGSCWIAPNAAPKLHANIRVVTRVVRRNSGRNSSRRLGRLSVPSAFFRCHAGDSGRKGRTRMSGSAGMRPEISV
jgi:hypothetical protein